MSEPRLIDIPANEKKGIPAGQAKLRDPDDLKVRHRRAIESATVAAADVLAKLPPEMFQPLPERATDEEKKARALAIVEQMKDVELSPKDAGLLMGLQDATVFAFLESWTIPDAFPKQLEDVGDMRPEVYDAIANATKVDGAQVAMDFSPSNDKSDPTGGSRNSAGA